MAVAARGEEHQGKEEEKQEQLAVKLQEQHQRMQQQSRAQAAAAAPLGAPVPARLKINPTKARPAGWWLWLPCRSVDMVGVRLVTNYRAKINETLVRNRDHETGTSRTYERIERAGDGAYNLTKGLPVED